MICLCLSKFIYRLHTERSCALFVYSLFIHASFVWLSSPRIYMRCVKVVDCVLSFFIFFFARYMEKKETTGIVWHKSLHSLCVVCVRGKLKSSKLYVVFLL